MMRATNARFLATPQPVEVYLDWLWLNMLYTTQELLALLSWDGQRWYYRMEEA